jgi:hypothetical protein
VPITDGKLQHISLSEELLYLNLNIYILSASFHIKLRQKGVIYTHRIEQFSETVVPMEVSIPAKFYCFMGTRILKADIQSSKNLFLGHKLS